MRNAFERGLAAQLRKLGASFKYESLKLPYSVDYEYWPDFILKNGIIIEAKGKLDTETKRKMIAVKKAYPDKDIRFVFYDAHRPTVGTKMTCGEWASRNGFQWAHKEIPEEWLK